MKSLFLLYLQAWIPSHICYCECSHIFQICSKASLKHFRRHVLLFWGKKITSKNRFNYLHKKLHHRCLTGFSLCFNTQRPLCEKCPYSEFFRSVFSRIWTEYRHGGSLRIQSKYREKRTEELRIQALFTQWSPGECC